MFLLDVSYLNDYHNNMDFLVYSQKLKTVFIPLKIDLINPMNVPIKNILICNFFCLFRY